MFASSVLVAVALLSAAFLGLVRMGRRIAKAYATHRRAFVAARKDGRK
jgi:hypothetical protein